MKIKYNLTIDENTKTFKNRYIAKYMLKKALKEKRKTIRLIAIYNDGGAIFVSTLFGN